MAKRKLYLHLGLPKTATTFLQRNFFSKLSGVRYLGREHGIHDYEQFINGLGNYLHFYPRAALRNQLSLVESLIEKDEVNKFGNIDPALPIFISDEGLTFRFFDAFAKQWYGRSAACSENFFERLSWFSNQSNFDVHPILVLRRQVDWLPSFYAQKFMHLTRFENTSTFQDFLQYALNDGYYNSGFNNLDYSYLTGLCQQYFDSILLLPYELLSDKPEIFYREIAGFTGKTTNDIALPAREERVNKSRLEGEGRTYRVKIKIVKDPVYRQLKAVKKRIRIMPLPKGWIAKWRYPESGRIFQVTPENEELINDFFNPSNKKVMNNNELFHSAWRHYA